MPPQPITLLSIGGPFGSIIGPTDDPLDIDRSAFYPIFPESYSELEWPPSILILDENIPLALFPSWIQDTPVARHIREIWSTPLRPGLSDARDVLAEAERYGQDVGDGGEDGNDEPDDPT